MRWSFAPSHSPPASVPRPRTTRPSGKFVDVGAEPLEKLAGRLQTVALLDAKPASVDEARLASGKGGDDGEHRHKVRNLGRIDRHAVQRAGADRHGVLRQGHVGAEGLENVRDGAVPLAGVRAQARERDAPAERARAEPEGGVRPVAFDGGGAGTRKARPALDLEASALACACDRSAEKREHVERHVDVGGRLDAAVSVSVLLPGTTESAKRRPPMNCEETSAARL